jgi:host factor-I protein
MNVKPPINVQDGFFYQVRKDNTLVEVTLLSEKKRIGRIRRFDKYAVVLEVDGREEMIYKHAVASVAILGGAAPSVPGVPSGARPPGA